MQYPIVYTFKLTLDDYREMSFFSTFSHRRNQSIVLFFVWIVATAAFFLDVANKIELSETVHLCALMVAVSVPILFFSVWINVHKFKVHGEQYRKKMHTVLLGKDDVRYSESDSRSTGTDQWDDFVYAFETKNMFLLYRTPNNAVLLPKRGVPARQIEETRACLKEKLGAKFKIRCRVK
ncbi:MAG: YcxB family protein [Oscillospiraceae bacterium]|nr:YcxB family protein [Oscillospiraceae bacterium]MCI1990402.1 YcxB family protein [Oscillospiraceae bacterium]MCI2035944.1 YcxB family protein [Oscillospiraceae bacterium]